MSTNQSIGTNFDFPIVRGIEGKMRHRPVPAKLGNSNFQSDYSWDEIKEIIVGYFQKKGIKYLLSYATSAFTVTSAPNDSKLQIDIIAYLEESGSFILEFKRLCGDIFTGADIFCDLKTLLHDKVSLDNLDEYNKQYYPHDQHNQNYQAGSLVENEADFDSLLV